MLKMLLTVVLLTFATTASAIDYEKVQHQIHDVNVIVGNGCSGAIVDVQNKLILTASHCVTAANGMKKNELTEQDEVQVTQLTFKDYSTIQTITYTAKVVVDNKKRDVAVIQAVIDKLPTDYQIEIYSGPFFTLGQEVYHIGNPGLEYYTFVKGYVSKTHTVIPAINNLHGVQLVLSGAGGGSSGGAVYNDAGQLVGTINAGRGDRLQLALMVPYTFIKPVIEEAKAAVTKK